MTNTRGDKIFSHDFILVFFSQFAFSMSYHLLLPTLPIYLLRLGSKEAEIGLLIGIFGVSSLLLRPFIGKGLQKIPERYFMMMGSFIFTLTSGALIISPPFWPFLIVRLFQGVAFAFFNTAAMMLIANISPDVHRGKSLGYYLLAINISFALGPSLGIFIINHFNFNILFITCLSLSLISLLITYKLNKKEVIHEGNTKSESGHFINWDAIAPSIVGFFFVFIFGSLTTFFPLHAIESGISNPGFFFTTIAIMLILGRTLGGRIFDLSNRGLVIIPCIIISILSMILLSFSKTLPMFIAVGIIWGIGHAFFFPTLVAYMLDRVGSSRGLAMGTFTGLHDLGVAIGPVAMGIVIHFTSYRVMFLILALLGFINLIYFYLSKKK